MGRWRLNATCVEGNGCPAAGLLPMLLKAINQPCCKAFSLPEQLVEHHQLFVETGHGETWGHRPVERSLKCRFCRHIQDSSSTGIVAFAMQSQVPGTWAFTIAA